MANKLLLLDLDGTVREPKSRAKFINDPKDQRIIEGASEAIAYFSRAWEIIGITNQGGVAAGHKSLEMAFKEQEITLELLPEMSCIYFCPDYEGENCYQVSREQISVHKRSKLPNPHIPGTLLYPSFRKPGSGMLRLAFDRLDFYPDDLWYVGDREEDFSAAEEADFDFLWADVWRSAFLKGMNQIDLRGRAMDQDLLVRFLGFDF